MQVGIISYTVYGIETCCHFDLSVEGIGKQIAPPCMADWPIANEIISFISGVFWGLTKYPLFIDQRAIDLPLVVSLIR